MSMKVKELINKLKEYDSEKNVTVMDEDGEIVYLDIVCEIKDESQRYKPVSYHGDVLLTYSDWE